MGYGSIDYYYVPAKEKKEYLVDLLNSCGAKATDKEQRLFVLKNDRYWIDVEVLPKTAPSFSSIRVALCNPGEVENALHTLFKELIAKGGGYIKDLFSKKEYFYLDQEAWENIWTSYVNKRKMFQEHFGTFEAPISGSIVFQYIRENFNNNLSN